METTTIDLFEKFEELPEELQNILTKYEDINTYNECNDMLKECEVIGYTFDYYFNAEPYNLRKME